MGLALKEIYAIVAENMKGTVFSFSVSALV